MSIEESCVKEIDAAYSAGYRHARLGGFVDPQFPSVPFAHDQFPLTRVAYLQGLRDGAAKAKAESSATAARKDMP